MTKIGNAVDYDFSELEINNINYLLRLLKSRLNSNSKAKATDKNGNTIYIDCDIFTNEVLVDFLVLALSEYNSAPSFTSISFEDTVSIRALVDILVEGAVLHSLASKALIERGREFQITDNGLNFEPPSVSELLETQFATLLNIHYEKIKNIKMFYKITF